MAFYREETGELFLKILYIGPSGCGKTTNIKGLYHHTQSGPLNLAQKPYLTTRNRAPFDFLPLQLGEIRGCQTIVHLFTLPPLNLWPVTQRTLLRGVDGLVYVWDSRPQSFGKNCYYFEKLEPLMSDFHQQGIPSVCQWNFKDSPKTLPHSVLQDAFNLDKNPSIEAVAVTGLGVLETLNALVHKLLNHMEGHSKERLAHLDPLPSIDVPPVNKINLEFQ